jgi:hypothetical protein
MPLIGPLYFKYRDFPGAKEIGELLQKVRDKQFPGLNEDEAGQPSVAQAQAQVKQLEQQLQMMGAQMQAAMKAIETEQVKQQATLQKAQMDNETKLQIARIDQETQITLKTIMAKLEELEAGRQRGHDALESEADRQHEGEMAIAKTALPEFGGPNPTPLEYPSEV